MQEANQDTLAGIFGEVAWANKDRLPEHALLRLVAIFDGIPLDPATVTHDMLGQAYEYLLREFAEASGKKAGEFFTPRTVVRLLTRLLDPQPGESIYDPACGSAGMLVEAVNEVAEAGGRHARHRRARDRASTTPRPAGRLVVRGPGWPRSGQFGHRTTYLAPLAPLARSEHTDVGLRHAAAVSGVVSCAATPPARATAPARTPAQRRTVRAARPPSHGRGR